MDQGTASQAWQKYWNCYRLAVQADAAFSAEVVRQFGRKRAGDMRYVSSAFDFATSVAAEQKHHFDALAHSTLTAARSFPVIPGGVR